MKTSTVVAALRSYANGGKKANLLPAARAWRIVAQPFATYAAGAPAVAAGVCPAMGANTYDGAYPLWVRLTEPKSRRELAELVYVDGAGWNFLPTGPGWRIEVVAHPAANLDTDRFVYVVETLDDEAEAHPIVTGGGSVPVAVNVATAAAASAPIVGASFEVTPNALDQQHATPVGSLLRLTAAGGDVFYAIDADATVAANRALLMAGATELVKAGAALHYTDGPTAGATLFVAQLP